MEGHTLVEIVLRRLHDLQISTLELVVEVYGRNLTGNHRHTARVLRLILVVIHLGHGVNAGHQVVDLNFAPGVGLDCLIDAVTGDGNGEVIRSSEYAAVCKRVLLPDGLRKCIHNPILSATYLHASPTDVYIRATQQADCHKSAE